MSNVGIVIVSHSQQVAAGTLKWCCRWWEMKFLLPGVVATLTVVWGPVWKNHGSHLKPGRIWGSCNG